MSENVTIGVNILETLTTGMYRDAKVIYREYIQNACDQIDDAVEQGLYERHDGSVEIWIKDDCVSIEDNATGIPAECFRETLYNIGDSKKVAGQNRGFRGIGHWCGIAHCDALIFVSKAVNEKIESVMTCDAAQMRFMMLEHRLKIKEYSIDDVLSRTTVFTTNIVGNVDSHYFKVVLKGISDVKDEICNVQNIKDYLSFTIPVGYATEFRFKKQIHEHAAEIGQNITEYNIKIEGEPVRKQYKPTFTTHGKGDDEIKGVQFKDFKDDKGNLVAWMWFGVSSFKAQMIPANKMRGIRLRSLNIQVGDESALQRLFNESNGRGLYYVTIQSQFDKSIKKCKYISHEARRIRTTGKKRINRNHISFNSTSV
jgi:molecular chaperone HtpG